MKLRTRNRLFFVDIQSLFFLKLFLVHRFSSRFSGWRGGRASLLCWRVVGESHLHRHPLCPGFPMLGDGPGGS